GLEDSCIAAYPDNGAGHNLQAKTSSGEGAAVTVNSDCYTDVARNSPPAFPTRRSSDLKTAPVLADLGPTTSPNGAGWYKADVTNRVRANDSTSVTESTRIPASAGNSAGHNLQAKTSSGEGAAVTVSSDGCTDVAGNSAP